MGHTTSQAVREDAMTIVIGDWRYGGDAVGGGVLYEGISWFGAASCMLQEGLGNRHVGP